MMSEVCNNCGKPNNEPVYQACAKCRAYWRSRDRKDGSSQKKISNDHRVAVLKEMGFEYIFKKSGDHVLWYKGITIRHTNLACAIQRIPLLLKRENKS